MQRYEILFLTVPEVTKDESESLEKAFVKLLQDSSAQLISYDRWGKYKLSYPVRNNEYGVYFLARFEAEREHVSKLLHEINTFCKIKQHNIIMRFIVSELDKNKSLTYQRPQSLEETPSRSRDTMQFLKEARAISEDTKTKSQETIKKQTQTPEVTEEISREEVSVAESVE